MSLSRRVTWSLPEFLAWEERQELRWEFDGVAPVAMTGGTIEHEAIGGTLRALLRDHLRGTPCRVLGPTIKILVDGRIRYPDALVTCTQAHPKATIAPDPVVVFEVLSPGTSATDRYLKAREYLATPSIHRYVSLEQDGIGAEVLTRRDDSWISTTLLEHDTLAMPEISVELAMADIYAESGVGPFQQSPDDR